jgi:RNA polymerase sigma factor (sigma-70 family)
MDEAKAEFAALMAQVRAQSPGAMEELYRRFGEHVQRVVRRRLHQRLRRCYDSQDFLQSVWASFVAVAPGQYSFQSPDELINYLCQIATNKIVEAVRQKLGSTQRHDISRETSLDERNPALAKPSRDPTPSQEVMADEQWERMLQGLTGIQRQVLLLLRQGYTHREVSDRLGLHPKVIQRFLRKLNERLDS